MFMETSDITNNIQIFVADPTLDLLDFHRPANLLIAKKKGNLQHVLLHVAHNNIHYKKLKKHVSLEVQPDLTKWLVFRMIQFASFKGFPKLFNAARFGQLGRLSENSHQSTPKILSLFRVGNHTSKSCQQQKAHLKKMTQQQQVAVEIVTTQMCH